MEVFKVFATMSLVDMISSPLGKIEGAMKAVTGKVEGLSNRLGKLSLAMAPVALAAAALLMALGGLSGRAIAFESSMADVAKVVSFETRAEMEAMSETILELSGRIPMAADGIAAIIAAAAQSGVAKGDLAEFAEQAAKMGVAFDLTGAQAGKMMADWRAGMDLTLPKVYALADAVNHLSNNMNATAPALGEVIQRVGAAAMSCGLAETQVAALGAAFLSAGASPEIAATALKKFTSTLVKGTAMSKDQAAAFQSLGLSVTQMAKDMQTDAQGTIFKVLQSLADKPKELQISLLTEMFGEEAIGAIAPLLRNMGNLSQAFSLVGDSASYAGSMQGEFETKSKTTQNALLLLNNKLTALGITIGNAFLPSIGFAAGLLGNLTDGVRRLMATPFAQWILRATAYVAAAVIAFTALCAGAFLLTKAGLLLGKAIAPLKAGFLALKGVLIGITWPIWAVIAVFAALYLAYRSNFGGFADTVDAWWKKVSMVFNGVRAVVDSMKNGVGEIRGALGQDIKAQGLLGVVTNISKVYYRITRLFSGISAGLAPALDAVGGILAKAFAPLAGLFTRIGKALSGLLSFLGQGEVSSAASEWETFGNIVGMAAGWLLKALATGLQLVVNALSMQFDMLGGVASILSGDFASAAAYGQSILKAFGDSILALADLFGFGDWLRESWQGAMDFLAGINLYESGAQIINTLIDGVKAKASALVDAVKSVFGKVRNLLPFSDAKEGPLSELTTSGGAIMTTLGQGVKANSGGLIDSISGVFAQAGGLFGKAKNGLFGGDIKASDLPLAGASIPAPQAPDAPGGFAKGEGKGAGGRSGESRSLTISIGNISLPNVADAKGFVAALQNLVAEYDGVPA